MKTKLSEKRKKEIMKQFGGHMPTKEELFQKIMESQERMVDALAGAWDTKPDDQKIREDLVEVGIKAAKLKKNIKEIFKKNK